MPKSWPIWEQRYQVQWMFEILFVPSVRKGNGSGHLARCFNLAMELGDQAGIYLPEDPGPDSWGAMHLRQIGRAHV